MSSSSPTRLHKWAVFDEMQSRFSTFADLDSARKYVKYLPPHNNGDTYIVKIIGVRDVDGKYRDLEENDL
jgi:hypothetical protein